MGIGEVLLDHREKLKRRSVFFDLDGVTADFVRGAFRLHGKSIPMSTVEWAFDRQLGIEPEVFWGGMDFTFWSTLDPHEDGLALLRYAESVFPKERIGLLTSPCNTVGCVDGKREWVRKHLPDYSNRLFVGSAKELFAGEGKYLIDDHGPNCEKFIAAGGESLLVPRPWNSKGSYCDDQGHFDPAVVAAQFEALLGRFENSVR